jgi:catechol 2,3-dioxygenase-like lactoylglutathione lyase family enzyme
MTDFKTQMTMLAGSVRKSDPMFFVPDMRATVRWYEAMGFTIADQFEDDGELVFARVSFGPCEFGLSAGGHSGPRDVRLWFYTDRVEDLYQLFRKGQLRGAQAPLAAGGDEPEIRFEENLYTPFYGGRQFSIQDLNGLHLIFWQPDWLAAGAPPTP